MRSLRLLRGAALLLLIGSLSACATVTPTTGPTSAAELQITPEPTTPSVTPPKKYGWGGQPSGGGGSGTITTSSPLSGDGSSGTPATIANGAIGLPKHAAQAGNTIIGNATGSSAVPTAIGLDACHSFAGGVLTDLCPFAADTTISILNGSSSAVSAWEGISTLTTATAGAEVSKYVIKLLDGASANHQVTAFSLTSTQMLVPIGQNSVNPITSGLGFVGATQGTGIMYMPTGGPGSQPALGISLANGVGTGGSPSILIDVNGNMRLMAATTGLGFGVNGTETIGRDLTNGGIAMRYNGTTVLEVTALKSVYIGATVATTATDGFLYINSCAGPPTGTPTTLTNEIPMVWDRTNHKLYLYDGSWLAMN